MNSIEGNLCYMEDCEIDMVYGKGAIVYDIVDGGDPELGWMVYDFRKWTAKCYAVSEQDLAGLVNELPSHVFPF